MALILSSGDLILEVMRNQVIISYFEKDLLNRLLNMATTMPINTS